MPIQYKPIIFISYAHEDEPEKPAEGDIKWLSFVTGFLRPAMKQGAVDIWIDRLMRGGDSVDLEIQRKLRSCDIFILLVSRHSLSSDYIVDKEIGLIRERQANGEDVQFYPLVLTPTPEFGLDLVRDKNLRPRDGKPLFDYSLSDRYRHMNEAANEIATIAGEITARKSRPPPADRLSGYNTISDQYGGFIASPLYYTPLGEAGRGTEPEVEGLGRNFEPRLENQGSLGDWLRLRSKEVQVALASRAALRVLPMMVREAQQRRRTKDAEEFLQAATGFTWLLGATFRANSIAWVAAKFRPADDQFVSATRRAAETAFDHVDSVGPAAHTIATVATAAAYAVARPNYAPGIAVGQIAEAVAGTARSFDYPSLWEEVRSDAAKLLESDPSAVLDRPLWSRGAPKWSTDAWIELRSLIQSGQDWNWDVWIDWYEDRQRGGSRGV
jgi:hypothetical protein